MKIVIGSFAAFYTLPAIIRSFGLVFGVLLPVFYAEKLVKAQQIGIIGALEIMSLIVAALIVARWLHNWPTRKLLLWSGALGLLTCGLMAIGIVGRDLWLITSAFCLMGFSQGFATSGYNALSANLTERGERFRKLARQYMIQDVARVVVPLMVAGLVILKGSLGGVLLASLLAVVTCLMCFGLPSSSKVKEIKSEDGSGWKLLRNKPFRFILWLEFLDSLSCSELFIFLPLVLLAKGFSLESSILLQCFLFLGYFSGRWLVGYVAKRYSGLKAVGYAEIGMVVSIVLLLLVSQLWLLYLLCFAMGIFVRGTAPAIKSMGFDAIGDHEFKQGSAVFVIAGDSGSVIGILLFGFLVAWYGANAPLILAAGVAAVMAVACLVRPRQVA